MDIGDRVRVADGRAGVVVAVQGDQVAVRYDGGDDEGWHPALEVTALG